MVAAHYMKFVRGHHGALDRIGGVPSHVPPVWLTSADSMAPGLVRPMRPGPPMRFLAQFYCDPVRLPLAGTLCLQIYQCDPEEDPWPAFLKVPLDARPNTEQLGIPQPGVIAHDIEWEVRSDPDEASLDDVELAKSKAGGTCYFDGCLDPGERLLLQLRERPGEFNFGGYTMVLTINQQGEIRATIG
jgi:hypothetical protein